MDNKNSFLRKFDRGAAANIRLSCYRRVIENAFRILVSRGQIFSTLIQANVANVEREMSSHVCLCITTQGKQITSFTFLQDLLTVREYKKQEMVQFLWGNGELRARWEH